MKPRKVLLASHEDVLEARRIYKCKNRAHINEVERLRYQRKKESILPVIRARRVVDKKHLVTNRKYYARNRTKIIQYKRDLRSKNGLQNVAP